MLTIIGLGNPGKKYDKTWHNLGFMVLDRLADKYELNFKAGKGSYISTTGFIGTSKVLFVKPTTYMNLSGNAVLDVMNYFNINTKDILVIYDDINLTFGNVRLRALGSAGGHNGLKSIINSIGSNDFPRLRVGFKTKVIQTISDNNKNARADIVLSKIPKTNLAEINTILDTAIDAIDFYLENGLAMSMNKYNKKEN